VSVGVPAGSADATLHNGQWLSRLPERLEQ